MAIHLYIVRHGEAEAMIQQDDQRQLTPVGKQEALTTALWLAEQVNQFDRVYVSPYIRAQQTAEIIENTGPTTITKQTDDSITPAGDPARVADWLLAQMPVGGDSEHNVLVVSHMPLVSYLIGELTGYTPIMATAAVAKITIDLENWNGKLTTLIAPSQMS